MKIISVSGYGFTGSGAVLDLLRELNNSLVIEFRELQFLSDPFGISDLEYVLVDNITKHNADYYIKMFISNLTVNSNGITPYTDVFGDNYKKITTEYINSIISFSKIDRPYFENDVQPNLRISRINKINSYLKKILPSQRVRTLIKHSFPNLFEPITPKTTYYSFPSNNFLRLTRNYTSNLISSINNGFDYIVLNQLINASNPTRYLRYVEDAKAIIVDRDPRDVYLENKITNHDKYMRMNVEEFVIYFKGIHAQSNLLYDECLANILFIRFEDLILKPHESNLSIASFLDLKINLTGSMLNTEISSKNIGLYKLDENKKFTNDIQYIECHLKDYLYDLNI